MKYPKEYLNEIKLRLKVSQIVGESVQLKKRGKEFIGLSPFNNEKSPSFTVSDEKEFYHCFSTGEHGNIFDFIMKTKSLGFGEAVKSLASKAGMPPYRFSNFDVKKEKKFQTYKSIYKDYLSFFHLELLKNENNEALDYLKKRGLNKKTIEEFNLGYVPWKNNFYQDLLKKYTEEDITLSGLYYKNDKTGNYVDRFNSRIIFPVNNLSGDPVAFGGRIIKESKLAKYINSPETEFYKKGRMLFNLDKAKSLRTETDEVIIVEGYMDVVSLYASGVKNVISNSGTALTEIQIELIWKFFSNPIVSLDGDISGQNAATRIAERLFPIINENNKIFFSIMPPGQDPDDFIKNNGKDEFLQLINRKKIIQDYIWDVYSAQIKKSDPFAVSRFEKKIKNFCYSIKDETLKKYILEDFLLKIKDLTPIQSKNKIFNKYYKKNFKEDFKILNETKSLHNQKNHYTKEQIKEHALLYIMLNHSNSVHSSIESISEVVLSSNKCDLLKKEILNSLSQNLTLKELDENLNAKFKPLISEINKNSALRNITIKKKENEISELIEELLLDLKEMNHLKKIQSLENKLSKNLDESSYNELMKLKNQLNSD